MTQDDEKQKLIINANYELFVLLITLLSIVNNVIWLFAVDLYARSVIQLIEYGISAFLVTDFFIRLIKTRHKRTYLIRYYGWLDFLGSLPLFGFRLARLARIFILGRKLHRSDLPEIENVVVERRAQSTLLLVIFLAVVTFEISGIFILKAELENPASNIRTASDALWWAYVTVATVGYGDRYPVTNSGRLVAIFLMTAGVGLFSVLTSFFADWFRRPHKPRASGLHRHDAPDSTNTRAKLDEIQRMLDEYQASQQKSIDELRSKLEEIEKNLGA